MIQHIPLNLRSRYVFCTAPINKKQTFVCTSFLKVRRSGSERGVRLNEVIEKRAERKEWLIRSRNAEVELAINNSVTGFIGVSMLSFACCPALTGLFSSSSFSLLVSSVEMSLWPLTGSVDMSAGLWLNPKTLKTWFTWKLFMMCWIFTSGWGNVVCTSAEEVLFSPPCLSISYHRYAKIPGCIHVYILCKCYFLISSCTYLIAFFVFFLYIVIYDEVNV